jgi:hypothetical protein
MQPLTKRQNDEIVTFSKNNKYKNTKADTKTRYKFVF